MSHSDMTFEQNLSPNEGKRENVDSKVDAMKISHSGADGATREAHAFYYPWYANDDVDGEFSYVRSGLVSHF